MAVADLYNVPTSKQEWAQFSFAHAAHHRDITAAILKQKNISLPQFILDPMSLEDLDIFAQQHQLIHNNETSLLGISGFDLSELNVKDQQQLASWIWLNASLHYLEAGSLGVW